MTDEQQRQQQKSQPKSKSKEVGKKLKNGFLNFIAILIWLIAFAGSCLLTYYGIADFRIDWLLAAACGFSFCFGPIVASYNHNKRK